jgi:hypothetical protein
VQAVLGDLKSDGWVNEGSELSVGAEICKLIIDKHECSLFLPLHRGVQLARAGAALRTLQTA